MTSNEFLTSEDGLHVCDMCGFMTPHLMKIKRHMVKSHGHEAYPEPPVLAAKWTEPAPKAATKVQGTTKKVPRTKGGK